MTVTQWSSVILDRVLYRGFYATGLIPKWLKIIKANDPPLCTQQCLNTRPQGIQVRASLTAVFISIDHATFVPREQRSGITTYLRSNQIKIRLILFLIGFVDLFSLLLSHLISHHGQSSPHLSGNQGGHLEDVSGRAHRWTNWAGLKYRWADYEMTKGNVSLRLGESSVSQYAMIGHAHWMASMHRYVCLHLYS